MKIRTVLKMAMSTFGNKVKGLGKPQLAFVAETENWVIKTISNSIVSNLKQYHSVNAFATPSRHGVNARIIHFGSVNTFFNNEGWYKPNKNQKVILTWFHVEPDDSRLPRIKEAQKDLAFIHTACESTKRTLVNAGVEESKILIIPLGIDLDLFNPVSQEKKAKIRNSLNIPENRLVIGSFQKDGVGWGEGNEPKYVKGPDTFIEVMEEIKDLNPFVLLTGPARGYVKNRLRKIGVEYTHVYLDEYEEVAPMFHVLDLYLISSRVEGGPMAILESMASGVPLVTTSVGMATDMVNGKNGLMSDVEDVKGLSESIREIVRSEDVKQGLIDNGLRTASTFDWKEITDQYYKKLYSSLL